MHKRDDGQENPFDLEKGSYLRATVQEPTGPPKTPPHRQEMSLCSITVGGEDGVEVDEPFLMTTEYVEPAASPPPTPGKWVTIDAEVVGAGQFLRLPEAVHRLVNRQRRKVQIRLRVLED